MTNTEKDKNSGKVMNEKLQQFDWVSSFSNGYARVKIGKVTNGRVNSGSKWGIINSDGEIVVPTEYDNIWNFYNKGRTSTILEKNCETTWFSLLTGKITNFEPAL